MNFFLLSISSFGCAKKKTYITKVNTCMLPTSVISLNKNGQLSCSFTLPKMVPVTWHEDYSLYLCIMYIIYIILVGWLLPYIMWISGSIQEKQMRKLFMSFIVANIRFV